jgi:hypothetical protein
MTESIVNTLLWLFVINLGIAIGAGLYERRIVVPQWLRFSPGSGYHWNAEAARQADVGLRFWAYVTTIPLTLLTLASLFAAWWTPPEMRGWWLGATAMALVDRVTTFTYFIPTMLKLMREDAFGKSQAVAKALQWANLDYVRLAVALVAWLMALKALSLIG